MFWQYNQLMELKALEPLLIIREHVNEIEPLNFFTLMDLPEDSSFFDSDKFRLVFVPINLWFMLTVQLVIIFLLSKLKVVVKMGVVYIYIFNLFPFGLRMSPTKQYPFFPILGDY